MTLKVPDISACQLKKEKILREAIRVFAQHGYRNTDVQVIADAAGVGKGTIYRYFGNKKDLFLAAADAGMKLVEERFFAAIENCSDPLDALRAATLACGEFFQDNPELVEILIQERAEFRGAIPETHLVYRQKNRGVIEEMLQRGVQTGQIRSDLDITQATNAFLNLLFGTVVCSTARISAATHLLIPILSAAVDIYIQGIRAYPLPTGVPGGPASQGSP